MLLRTLLLFAEDAPKQPEGGGAPWWGPLMLPVAIVVLFYFLLMRPMRRQEAQRQLLVANLKKGDKVITNAGIIGTVVAVGEKDDEVTVKVDDNCRLKMLKSAVARNVSAEEALKEQKPQAEPSKT